MSNLERVYQIDQMLSNRRFVKRHELLDRLGVSWATLKRDLSYMRDRLHAPIVFDRELGGYRFQDSPIQQGPQYELPGLWFSAEEIHALLTMQHLLSKLDSGGLLGPHIQPLLARLSGVLGSNNNSTEEIEKRIRIESMGARSFELAHFQTVASALLQRKRLALDYHAKGSNETTHREVSPLRLIHYRDNWYLDGWCHLRNGLRAFSVDSIQTAEILDRKARDVSHYKLDRELGAGYGIFSGQKLQWATLVFSQERSRWVSRETWHPQQKGSWLSDDTWQLQVPYADDRELIMDILKHGPHCKVMGPEPLVDRVKQQLLETIQTYQG